MESVLDHLDTAIEEIETAQEKAPLGTRLMLGELHEEAMSLRGRVAKILATSDTNE